MPRMTTRPYRGCTYWAYKSATVMLALAPSASVRLRLRSAVSRTVRNMPAATPLTTLWRKLLASTVRLISARSSVNDETATELLRNDLVGQLTAVAGHVTALCAAIAVLSLPTPVVALRSSTLAVKDRSTWRLTRWRYRIDEFELAGGCGDTCCKRRVPFAAGSVGGGGLAGSRGGLACGIGGGFKGGGCAGGDGRTAVTSQLVTSGKLHMAASPASRRGGSNPCN